MCDLQNNWVVPLHKMVAQTLKQMHEEGEFEDQGDPKQRKGSDVMRDQMTQTRHMIDSDKNKGRFNSENWCQRRAHSLSHQSDGLVYIKNRCHGDGPGVNQIKHASHCENWHFRGERGWDIGKLNEHSSNCDQWCKRRAHGSSCGSDRLLRYNRSDNDGHRVNQFENISGCENCHTRNYPSHDSIRNNECFPDIENWQMITARGSSPQSDQPVQKLNTHHSDDRSVNQFVDMRENFGAGNDHSWDSVKHAEHSSDIDQPGIYTSRGLSNMHSVDKFTHGSNCETCCSRNDCRWDGVQKNEHTSDIENWHKGKAQSSSHGSVWPVSNNRPHGDGYWFNQFKCVSYCEKCHYRNDRSQDRVKLYECSSDCENWSERIAYNSYQQGAQLVNNKNWHHSNKYWVNLFKHESHAKNWRFKDDCNKDEFQDANHSSDCENGQQKSPHNAFRYTISAIFKRKLNQKSYSNRQAVAQFKSDCGNWRSWNDCHRDHDHQNQSSEDMNWRSRRDCEREQVEHCDRSPDHHKVTEHCIANNNGEKKEPEDKKIHNTGKNLILKPDWLSMT